MDVPPSFDHEYRPARVVYGRGETDALATVLDDAGAERALVVTGSSVGANDGVMDPVRAGLGDRFAGHYDGTTPGKRAEEVAGALAAMDDASADALVAVGGGSSLDVAKAARLLAGDGRGAETLSELADGGGALRATTDDLPALVSVPTTLAGADLSLVGSVSVATGDGRARVGVSDRRAMPTACLYDPALVETTPLTALAGSAMNGFDKGIELLYAAHATAMTDATAMRGLSLLRSSLPYLRERGNEGDYERATAGTILVQYGLSTPRHGRLSVLHAYGHGLSRGYPVQQGVAHAVVAPHALRHLFETVDGRRDLLAEALGVTGEDEDPAPGVVAAVARVRDALGLPDRLRDVEGVDREDIPDVAAAVREDGILSNGPPGYDPDASAIEGVLRAAW